ncbi:ATP-binding protein [Actinomadura luteofluorescens]|uniref:ATP-binding protein n=1 Tax=Actinomadura luteofluorescens TaxID=46163 RepID=UPI003D93AC68
MSAVAQSPEVSTVVLEPTADAPLLARGFLADRFAAWGLTEDYAARVVVSELVTNAYRHGEGFIVVRLFLGLDGLPVLEVWDAGERRPVVKPQSDVAQSGRGLHIVSEMVETWGVRSLNEGGKVVWARLPIA